MWAKIAGAPLNTPLKARTLPWDGNGDCSGKRTSAEKLPSPISEGPQASIASWVVDGLIFPNRHLGRPPRSSLPALLKAKVTSCSWGRAPCLVEAMRPPIEIFTGATPWRGSLVGLSFPETETLTWSDWTSSALAAGAQAKRARAPAVSRARFKGG